MPVFDDKILISIHRFYFIIHKHHNDRTPTLHPNLVFICMCKWISRTCDVCLYTVAVYRGWANIVRWIIA